MSRILEIKNEFNKMKFPVKKETLGSFFMLLIFVSVASIILTLLDILLSFISLFY